MAACVVCTFVNVDVDERNECEMCGAHLPSKRSRPEPDEEVEEPVADDSLPNLSADALFAELEAEEEAAMGDDSAGTALRCLICRTSLNDAYFVLPACTQDHPLCQTCMDRALAAPKKRVRGQPAEPEGRVSCALCGATANVSQQSLLKRVVPQPMPESDSAEAGYCSECMLVTIPPHVHELQPLNEESAQTTKQSLAGNLMRLETRQGQIREVLDMANYRTSQIDESAARLREELKVGMEQIRELLVEKEAELSEAIDAAVVRRRGLAEEESRRLQGLQKRVSDAENLVHQMVESDDVRTVLHGRREAFNAMQKAQSGPLEPKMGEEFHPEQMGDLTAMSYLLHTVKRMKYSEESASELPPGLPMGLQHLMQSMGGAGAGQMLPGGGGLMFQIGAHPIQDNEEQDDDELDEEGMMY